jgi:hypothetical protein
MTNEAEHQARFLQAFAARTVQHLERVHDGRANEAYIALDIMRSMLSAHMGGIPANLIADAFPEADWRENMMLVPVSFLQTLSTGWERYLEEVKKVDGMTLGQCLGVESRFQGTSGVAKKAATIDKAQRLSNRVARLILDWEDGNRLAKVRHKVKLTSIFKQVAEEEKVSETAVKNAFRMYGRPYMDLYRKG